jgi:hypothetical protein
MLRNDKLSFASLMSGTCHRNFGEVFVAIVRNVTSKKSTVSSVSFLKVYIKCTVMVSSAI